MSDVFHLWSILGALPCVPPLWTIGKVAVRQFTSNSITTAMKKTRSRLVGLYSAEVHPDGKIQPTSFSIRCPTATAANAVAVLRSVPAAAAENDVRLPPPHATRAASVRGSSTAALSLEYADGQRTHHTHGAVDCFDNL